MTDPTVTALAEFSRRKPRAWRLVCPECGGAVKLSNGFYVCVLVPDGCAFASTTLGGLARGEEIRR